MYDDLTPDEIQALPPDDYRAYLLEHAVGAAPQNEMEGASCDASVVVCRQSLGHLDVDTSDPAQLHAAAMGALWLGVALARGFPILRNHPYSAACLRVSLLAGSAPAELDEAALGLTDEPTEGPLPPDVWLRAEDRGDPEPPETGPF